jgi:carbonic anhydrase|tara:strand:- start:1476 stop:2102 length:627 start_codon:yes stop_codon:yes gene_type:complete
MKAQTKQTQEAMSPDAALQALKDGNNRFITSTQVSRDLMQQVAETSKGQYPFATVLHCIDSRVSAELVFDQGIGDLFSIRIAGNFVNEDILGSMEFATKLAGTKVVVILGHTACGAVKGACDHAKLGNLTGMLEKIAPAVSQVKDPADASLRTSSNIDFVNRVAVKNVHMAIDNLRAMSPVLKEMEAAGEIKVVGAMYHIENGQVVFL